MDNLKIILEYCKDRSPEGRSDNGGRWYPSDKESCYCCNNIRSPSRSYPLNYYKHCHSQKHLKNLINENPKHIHKDLPEALLMTKDTAPQYINTESDLLKHVRDELLGINNNGLESK